MDNILKMVLGCLAIVALIVMVIPQGDPLSNAIPPSNSAPNEIAAGPPASLPPDAPKNVPPPPPPGNGSSFSVQDYDISSFGKPMVDPRPLSERQRSNNEEGNVPNNDNGPPPPPYGYQQPYNQQPTYAPPPPPPGGYYGPQQASGAPTSDD